MKINYKFKMINFLSWVTLSTANFMEDSSNIAILFTLLGFSKILEMSYIINFQLE